jgi:hypothetical protein
VPRSISLESGWRNRRTDLMNLVRATSVSTFMTAHDVSVLDASGSKVSRTWKVGQVILAIKLLILKHRRQTELGSDAV